MTATRVAYRQSTSHLPFGPTATRVLDRLPDPHGPVGDRGRAFLAHHLWLTAYHESGHAAAAMALGWPTNLLVLHIGTEDDGATFYVDTDAGRRAITDLAQVPEAAGVSLSGAPPCPEDEAERRAWCRIGGTVSWAGSVTENAVRRNRGLPLLPQPAIEYSRGDFDNFTRYRDQSPESPDEFALACNREAKRVVCEHGAEIENLASALLERGRLTIPECLHVWQRGVLSDSGKLGRFRFMSRADAPAWGCPIADALPHLAPPRMAA